jgi:hypothetical protein
MDWHGPKFAVVGARSYHPRGSATLGLETANVAPEQNRLHERIHCTLLPASAAPAFEQRILEY